MNSFLNSLMIWLDIHGSDLDFKNLIKSLAKWLKFKKLRLRFNSMNSFVNSFMIFSNIQIIKMSDIFRKFVNILNGWYIQLNLRMNSNEFIDEFKWIHWWILMNLLMNSNQFVDEFIEEFKWTHWWICWWILVNSLRNPSEFIEET